MQSLKCKQRTYPSINVVLWIAISVDNGFVCAQNVETESGRRTIIIVQSTGEQFGAVAQICASVPNHFRFTMLQSSGLILIVEATEEHTIVAHLGEERGLLAGMTERIDLPSNLRSTTLSEGIVEFTQTPSELVNRTLVVDSCFIVHAPSSADELQATLLDERFYLGLQRFGLLFPPFEEKLRFDVYES